MNILFKLISSLLSKFEGKKKIEQGKYTCIGNQLQHLQGTKIHIKLIDN